MHTRTVYILLLLIFYLLLPYPARAEERRSDLSVMRAMEWELNRSWQKLRLEGYESPYFISYQIKDNTYYSIEGKYGAIVSSEKNRTRRLFVDVRVGNYEFDNSIRGQSGGKVPFYNASYIPIDNEVDAIRAVLWQVTDYTYKEALTQYFNKKANRVQKVESERLPSFSRESGIVYYGPEIDLPFNPKEWESKIREISSVYKDYRELIDADVGITAQKETTYFINTEGTRYIRDEILYSIDAEVTTRAEDGEVIKNHRNLYYVSPEDLPSVEGIKSVIRDMVEETLRVRKAEVLQPVTVPAILEPEAAGVVFHEAVGHRLEGERQIDDKEGQTFKERVGERIIPTFLSITDDPTMESFNGIHLIGYYPFDDQGVPGQRVLLVENGVLRNFLLSRTPINGFSKSNGHGRASYGRAPMARMSNLLIRSSSGYPRERLKGLLIREIKRQRKPFGLIIKRMEGGETNTSSYDFQAFKATPLVVYKVDPKTGHETPVRGVEIVGTPLVSINKIIATGDDYAVFNGFCGAESGYVPVSTIAPSILLSEIELQRISEKREKLPLLPPPFFDGSKPETPDTVKSPYIKKDQ
ncbi:MAG TPA: metallopeptidase TldD-related protein [Thermodesulfobacteriota bacterium]|nr:metallopeptidase TldD-related protein [Thermodesulfobacteriota bacterium]